MERLHLQNYRRKNSWKSLLNVSTIFLLKSRTVKPKLCGNFSHTNLLGSSVFHSCGCWGLYTYIQWPTHTHAHTQAQIYVHTCGLFFPFCKFISHVFLCYSSPKSKWWISKMKQMLQKSSVACLQRSLIGCCQLTISISVLC